MQKVGAGLAGSDWLEGLCVLFTKQVRPLWGSSKLSIMYGIFNLDKKVWIPARMQRSMKTETKPAFVAINYITCEPSYCARFECLFCTRARQIDTMPGFISMQVLRPMKQGEPYLVISQWESQEAFDAWVGSPEFLEGHKRGFEDVTEAKRRGEEPPMRSTFQTYSLVTD
jgi:heme oxygenase (mycobilin-producing)